MKRIRELVEKAWQRRHHLRKHQTSFRAIHHGADDLSNIEADLFHNTLMLTTSSIEADHILDSVIQTCVEVMQPDGIFIANHRNIRQRQNLPLYQAIAYGHVPPLLKIQEENFECEYAPDSETAFPLHKRILRQWGSQISPDAKRLVIGDATAIVTHSAISQCLQIKTDMLANMTSELRAAKEQNQRMAQITLTHPEPREIKSLNTGLWHFYHTLMSLLEDDGEIHIETKQPKRVLFFLKSIAKKTHHQLRLLESTGMPEDFPRTVAQADREPQFLRISVGFP